MRASLDRRADGTGLFEAIVRKEPPSAAQRATLAPSVRERPPPPLALIVRERPPLRSPHGIYSSLTARARTATLAIGCVALGSLQIVRKQPPFR